VVESATGLQGDQFLEENNLLRPTNFQWEFGKIYSGFPPAAVLSVRMGQIYDTLTQFQVEDIQKALDKRCIKAVALASPKKASCGGQQEDRRSSGNSHHNASIFDIPPGSMRCVPSEYDGQLALSQFFNPPCDLQTILAQLNQYEANHNTDMEVLRKDNQFWKSEAESDRRKLDTQRTEAEEKISALERQAVTASATIYQLESDSQTNTEDLKQENARLEKANAEIIRLELATTESQQARDKLERGLEIHKDTIKDLQSKLKFQEAKHKAAMKIRDIGLQKLLSENDSRYQQVLQLEQQLYNEVANRRSFIQIGLEQVLWDLDNGVS